MRYAPQHVAANTVVCIAAAVCPASWAMAAEEKLHTGLGGPTGDDYCAMCLIDLGFGLGIVRVYHKVSRVLD